MGSYARSVRTPGEGICYETKLHWFFLFDFKVLFLILLVVGVIVLLYRIIVRMSSEFVVTTKRVICKNKFIARHSFEIPLRQIESITIDQSVLGRIFNYGTVRIKGVGGSAQDFIKVKAPMRFKRAIEEQRTYG